MHQTRGELWHQVWTDREEDRADWNGYEACFGSLEEYEEWTRGVAERIRLRLDLSARDTVADLGCGTGRIASLIAPHVKTVLAFDYSDAVLATAKRRRSVANVVYQWADLNLVESREIPATKAYAVGSLFYLDSEAHVFRLLDGFCHRGLAVAAIDLPDEDVVEHRKRSYDTSRFTHVKFSATRLLAHYPTGEIERGTAPNYVNDATRFDFYVRDPAAAGEG